MNKNILGDFQICISVRLSFSKIRQLSEQCLCPLLEGILVFVIFCSRIILSKELLNSSLICNRSQLIGFHMIPPVFIENNVRTEWFYPRGYIVWIGHKWEGQMMSKAFQWSMSCIHVGVYFFVEILDEKPLQRDKSTYD